MGQRIACPFPEYDDTDREGNPVYYIELPDKWTAEHAQRRDRVIEQTVDSGLGDTVRGLMVALALLDSWHLPGLSMQQVQDKAVTGFDLELMTWVTQTVMFEYRSRTTCPKGQSVPLSVLARVAAKAEPQEPGQSSTAGDSESAT